MYLFSLFHERRFSSAQRVLFFLPFIVGCALMAYSLFTGFVFTIDGTNAYRRGPGMVFLAAINYSYIVPAAILILKRRDAIKRRTLLIVIAYTVIPCAGSLLQLLFYGIITAWPSFVLALLVITVFLENRRSDRDYLTGLLNRQSFDARAYRRIEPRDSRGGFALVVIDLDRFKAINDAYGHDKGDEILQVAAGILTHSLSVNDTIARYGGAYGLSMSAGYAILDPASGEGFDSLFRRADALMFEVKNARHKA